MRLKSALGLILVLAAALLLWAFVPWAGISQWAMDTQRDFQNAMARALRAIQRGDPWATVTLCSATFAYGFVHALGPGHGKIVLGGAAMASGVSLPHMLGLTLASSLAQSGTAIALIAALLWVLQLGTQQAVNLTEAWLAPLSYAAIGLLGGVLVWRGVRALMRQRQTHHVQDGPCGCGHAHGPSVADMRSLASFRDAVALVAAIAIRPCTGALFVLVIAARFDMFATGALSVVAMGLGTAAFNGMVATSGVMARRMARLGAQEAGTAQNIAALLHLAGGGLIMVLSLMLLAPHLG